MKKIVSIILTIILLSSTLLLSSCDYLSFGGRNHNIPGWYVGGYEGIHNGMGMEFYWVETYDEMLAAVESLKSHGSTFGESMIFNYDSELFDTKYCFVMKRDKAESIEWGEDPFDRKVLDVSIKSVAFLDDVTVDWVTKNLVSQCDSYELDYANLDLGNLRDVDFSDLSYEWKSDNGKKVCTISLGENEKVQLVGEYTNNADYMSDECLDALLGSIVFVP